MTPSYEIGEPALATIHREALGYGGVYCHEHIGLEYWVVHPGVRGTETFRVLQRIDYGHRVPRTLKEQRLVSGKWENVQ